MKCSYSSDRCGPRRKRGGGAPLWACFAALCLWGAPGADGAENAAGPAACQLRVDLSRGEWEMALPDGAPLLGVAPLFSLGFADGETIGPAEMTARPDGADPMRATFLHPRAELAVWIVEEPDRVVFHGEVSCKQGAITRVAIPEQFVLLGRPRARFLWPRVLGVELNESYLASSGQMSIGYPPAFCDFCAAEIAGTPIYFYRCEPEERPRPGSLSIQGGDPAVFQRAYTTYVREGERWAAPAAACQIGGDLREALLRYKRECALGKPLSEKMSPEFYARWSHMAEARIPSPEEGGLRVLKALPAPAVAEITNWMFGGFNRKFPDFLPPNAQFGGEEGLREFVRAAHECGHLVRPYVNFTWWSEGWEGPDRRPDPNSQAAPSLVKYGQAALSRDLKGELMYENYHGAYGYRSCPAHPLVVEQSRQVRDALLDDYGADFLYQDQMGARRWALDLNPALENPADYGAALMAIGREAARRCPIATEFGSDRALEFAVTLNYWALPPLSPILNITGESRPPWEEGQGRSFPYALYLSSGDAVPQVKECLDPAWLAWSTLLGGRVSLGTATEAMAEGPDHEAATFLQEFAQGIGARAVGDRLVKFEYLAGRVARAVFERHEVIANFGQEPWPLEGGGAAAADGFDLRCRDGFRAGGYAGASGERVLAILDPQGGSATTLAPGGFEVRIGSRILRAEAPPVKRTTAGRRTALIDFGADIGAGKRGAATAEALAEAFRALSPSPIRSLEEFEKELPRCRVLVNGQSECFPAPDPDDWPAAVSRLREWCEAGGVWVELGRWPLWRIVAPDPQGGANAWQYKTIGKAGFENLCGERCWLSRRPKNPPKPQGLQVTPLGRSVFSGATIQALENQSATVTRPPADFPNPLSLCQNPDGNYIMVHPTGYGAVVRLGGAPIGPALAALAETVEAILAGKLDLGGPVWRAPLCRRIQPES